MRSPCTCFRDSNRVLLHCPPVSLLSRVTSRHLTNAFLTLLSFPPLFLSLSLFSIYLVPPSSFQPFPLSISFSLSTGAKQIAKYPQVVDFSDYVLRIAYHRTCQDEYRQSWMECKWSVCWGEQRRFRWALKLYCSYRGWTSTKFYRVIGFLFYYRGWGLRMNVSTTCYMTCYIT